MDHHHGGENSCHEKMAGYDHRHRQEEEEYISVESSSSPPPPLNAVGSVVSVNVPGMITTVVKSPNSLTPTMKENVFENPVILRHLFKVCPLSTLRQCRMVNKLWYNELLIIWRNEAHIDILNRNPNGLSVVHRRTWKNEFYTSLSTFEQFMLDNPENQFDTKPFRSAVIYAPEYKSTYKSFGMFWNNIGINLTKIKLIVCEFNNKEFFNIVFNYCPALQNVFLDECVVSENFGDQQQYVDNYFANNIKYGKKLKYLHIILAGVSSNQFCWVPFLSNLPELTSVIIHRYVGRHEDDFELLTTALFEIRRKKSAKKILQQLKHFEFGDLFLGHSTNSYQQFNIIRKLCLPLSKLHVRIHKDMDEKFLENVIRFHASSLKKIQVYRESIKMEIPNWLLDITFGNELINLTCLTLDVDMCGNFMFLKNTPNLSDLTINEIRKNEQAFNKISIMFDSTAELSNIVMRRLIRLYVRVELNGNQDLEQICKWMPNLKSLHISLSNEQFETVCASLKCLRYLDVVKNELLTLEGILTGMKKMSQATEDSLKSETRLAISNLECLEILSVGVGVTLEAQKILFGSVDTLRMIEDISNPAHTRRYDRADVIVN